MDVALVSEGSGLLRVYPGNRNGTLGEPVDCGAIGSSPVFLIATDLDRDGHNGLIFADQGTSTLTIFFGREGEQFFESSDSVSGFGASKRGALVHFDHNRVPDMVLISATLARAYIYLQPAGTATTRPSIFVELGALYSSIAIADLNADGVPT